MKTLKSKMQMGKMDVKGLFFPHHPDHGIMYQSLTQFH